MSVRKTYAGVRVDIIVCHPNVEDLTKKGRTYAYNWLRCRIGAQITVSLPLAVVNVKFTSDSSEEGESISGFTTKTDANNAVAYVQSVLFDAYKEWFDHVQFLEGVTPKGDLLFTEEEF